MYSAESSKPAANCPIGLCRLVCISACYMLQSVGACHGNRCLSCCLDRDARDRSSTDTRPIGEGAGGTACRSTSPTLDASRARCGPLERAWETLGFAAGTGWRSRREAPCSPEGGSHWVSFDRVQLRVHAFPLWCALGCLIEEHSRVHRVSLEFSEP